MSRNLGVLRDRDGMRRAIGDLLRLAEGNDAALVALTIAVSALRREESRGAHWRTDCPGTARLALRSRVTLDEALQAARDLVCVAA